MNRIIIIALLVFAFGKCDFLRANTITIESIDSLNDVCYDVGKSDPDASFQMALNILKRAEKIDYINGQMTALCRMGRAVYKKNKLDSAMYYYDLSEELFSRKGTDSLFLAKTYVYQGLVYKKMGNLDQASSKYRAAYYVAKSSENEDLMSSCLINTSNIYIGKEEYKEAHILLNDALRSFSPSNLEKIGLVYLSKGNIFDLEERFTAADEVYRKALVCFQKTEDSLGIAKSLLSIGNICLKTDKADSARFYYDRTHKIAVEHEFHGILAKTYQNKGEYFYQKYLIDSAFVYFTQSIESNELSGSVADLSLAYERLGDIYLIKGSFSESLVNYLVAFRSSEDLSDYSQLKDLTYKISTVYSLTGQTDSALVYMTFSNGYQDSISQRLSEALIYEIDFTKEKHKVQTLNAKIERQASDLKKRTTISRLSIVIGLIALTLFISVILYYRQRKKNILKQKKIDDLLNKQSEETMYAMLDGQESEKNRIASELHDTLGSILSTVKLYFKSMDKEIDQLKQENIEQFEKANELLDEAVQEVRKISHDLSTGVLKDLGLFRAVKNLISKIEGSGEIQIELMTHGTDDDLLIVNQSAIYRIIQESLSNTLKHAKAKKVSIQLNVFEDLFNLIIEDDGVGFDANQMVSNIGMGLRSNKARVSKMNGTFNIDSGKGIGTTINIDIPLEGNAKKNEDGED